MGAIQRSIPPLPNAWSARVDTCIHLLQFCLYTNEDDLDASANGTLLDKSPREGLEILEKLAQNYYQHPTTRRGSMRQGTAQLDSSDTILAQISALTNIVKNM
ncbi:hypothetical protein V6N13_109629 [Hibiscus sabdariffa]|uniref:Uncharacterized protein n=1 Tax=Hibiscus sabdariffa TaxID=183260 RepID=A0ABR2FQB0_9ROSI